MTMGDPDSESYETSWSRKERKDTCKRIPDGAGARPGGSGVCTVALRFASRSHREILLVPEAGSRALLDFEFLSTIAEHKNER